ncbi:MAG: cob(I)yrinic acid a,c-diamide adenosyltransferase, partial [Desulfovibrionaceae bacterium]
MIIVYTGHGKGKTSACVGQAVRALGQDMTVAFAQFMKKDGQAGEQRMLTRLLGENFLAGGCGFLRKPEERPKHREAALATLAWALERMPHADMLVLDESVYALNADILTRTEVEGVLAKAREYATHVVLSGRNSPEWLNNAADLVTEMG